jgi:hypothetical protein
MTSLCLNIPTVFASSSSWTLGHWSRGTANTEWMARSEFVARGFFELVAVDSAEPSAFIVSTSPAQSQEDVLS